MSGPKHTKPENSPSQRSSLAERSADLKGSLTRKRPRRAKAETMPVPASNVTSISPVPTAGIPADLADACFREAEHWNWLDIEGNTDGMSEEAWDAAFARQKVVWDRAITEPSTTLRDLAAKAELLRHDFDRFYPAKDHDSDNFRLLRVMLREAAGLAPTPDPTAGGLIADLHAMTGGVHHDDGTVSFCDAAGTVLRKPTADWIGSTAMRMHHQMRVEMARQINDPALSNDERAALALRLRRDLRADAVFALAFKPWAMFEKARAEEEGAPPPPASPARHYQPEAVSPDLRAAIEAHREARQLVMHDPVDDDERLSAAVERARRLGDVVRAVPVRSMADLRWKMIYLWPGSLDGEVNDHEVRDTFTAFREDVQRLAAHLDPHEPAETDKQVQARLAATPFAVSDINGPCPVPTKARWIEDAKSTLVWLRFGFVILCSDREKLTAILGDQDERQFVEMQDGLGIALRNFTQMAAVAQQALDRIQIGLAILAEDEDRAAEAGEA